MKNELTRAGLTGRRTVSSIAGRSESKSAFDYIGAIVIVCDRLSFGRADGQLRL